MSIFKYFKLNSFSFLEITNMTNWKTRSMHF